MNKKRRGLKALSMYRIGLLTCFTPIPGILAVDRFLKAAAV
jgi:hypothetical protein